MTLAGFQGTVTESQEAQRFYRAGAAAMFDTPNSLKPTSSGTRTISIAPGSMLCCGVFYSESAAQTISLNQNLGSTRYDVVGLRFTWSGESSGVQLFTKQGTSGSSNIPALTRNPGSTYEVPIAVVRVRQYASNINATDVLDVRVWGGLGGPFQMAQGEYVNVVDVPRGAQIQAGGDTYTVTSNDGAGNIGISLVSAADAPWIAYDPVLSTFLDGVCNLGAGGVRRGFYQVRDDTVFVKFEIRKGTGAINFGRGNFKIDLPAGYRPSADFTDQWGDGVLNTNVGDGFYNWQLKFLIRNDQNNYVVPYATTNGVDIRLLPMRSAGEDGSPAGAIPQVRDAPGGNIVYLDPNVIMGSLNYKLAS